jgi:hypothetical protein
VVAEESHAYTGALGKIGAAELILMGEQLNKTKPGGIRHRPEYTRSIFNGQRLHSSIVDDQLVK